MSVLLVQTSQTQVGTVNVHDSVYKGEAFRANTGGLDWSTIDYIILQIGRFNNPGDAQLKVYSTPYAELADLPVGVISVTALVGSKDLDTSGWSHNFVLNRTFTFASPINVSDGVYLVTLGGSSLGGSDYIKWRYGTPVVGNGRLESLDAGSTWSNDSGGNAKLTQIYGTYATPSKATNPTPSNAAADVTLNQATITWEDGGGADTYDVYYGDTSGSLVKVSDAQAGLSLTITGIDDGSPFNHIVTRYWRIDSTNGAGTTTGDEWSFTTIRFYPPGPIYYYPTGNYYYQLLVNTNGGYGDHPVDGGVEDTDYVVVTIPPSPMVTKRRLVAVANNKFWFEDV